MKSTLFTVIPVYNGADFIVPTLESVATQTRQPDRVIVQDNRSADNTEALVKNFKAVRCEWRQNEANLGTFGNCNRGLELAEQTDYLHFLCADDVLKPDFYARTVRELESCDGLGLAYSLDERIDENNQRLSVSGKVTGQVEVQSVDDFVREKAEIANQAFSGSLLKTARRKSPVPFRMDMPILADVVFWGEWGRHCQKIVRIHEPLVQYRWHGTNVTSGYAPQLQPLILDEWRAMQMLEQLRKTKPGPARQFKLKGMFAVRSGIKAKRFRQLGNPDYSREIVKAARPISGPLAWFLAQMIVEARDFAVYTVGGRKRHPKNVYG